MTITTTRIGAPGAPQTTDSAGMLRRRIGSTEYLISVRYCQSAKEELDAKILRLIESEVLQSA